MTAPLIAKFTFSLASGKTVDVTQEYEGDPDDATAESIAEELFGFLATSKPGWFQLNNTLVFTGAVSAIQVDIH